MAQKKGQTGNPNGRPRGVPNKTTKTAREWLISLVDKNRVQIERDLKALDPKDRLIILEKLMAYTIPKASSVNISFEKLEEFQIDEIVNELSNQLKE